MLIDQLVLVAFVLNSYHRLLPLARLYRCILYPVRGRADAPTVAVTLRPDDFPLIDTSYKIALKYRKVL